ncbi:MAG: DUF4358 domain-containing protein [Eubacteriales bacterium]|nr:DUF4358 domain-containing protein [Eubacteriales bacterium]
MKAMRHYIGVLLLTFFLISLSGCSKQSDETEMSLQDIAAAVIESQSELPPLKQITSEDEDFAFWITGYYLLPEEKVADGVICFADDMEASEIAVLLLADEKDSKEAEEALAKYIQNRANVYEGYAPEQAALAKNGIAVSNGKYIALLICQEPSAAKTAFLGCFGKKVTDNSAKKAADNKNNTEAKSTSVSASETEVQTEAAASSAYDSEAVLQAWKSGNDSSLSDINRSILEAARDVIDQEIKDDMTDYEKELAIHDWITQWCSFDYSVFGRSASDGFAEGSDTPYGVLIHRSAMCHGYSSAFQLFMDMLNIPCITVFGTPGSNGVEHSWNMVKLDDEWYCVDAAWDDPIGGGGPVHTYFNVTSEYLRKGSIHQWDESSVPEATATEYAYGNH